MPACDRQLDAIAAAGAPVVSAASAGPQRESRLRLARTRLENGMSPAETIASRSLTALGEPVASASVADVIAVAIATFMAMKLSPTACNFSLTMRSISRRSPAVGCALLIHIWLSRAPITQGDKVIRLAISVAVLLSLIICLSKGRAIGSPALLKWEPIPAKVQGTIGERDHTERNRDEMVTGPRLHRVIKNMRETPVRRNRAANAPLSRHSLCLRNWS